ncbi:MAG: phage tail protein [Bacteroidia bacterium]|nr:phage tail protein [Bacteroidia bacterium]
MADYPIARGFHFRADFESITDEKNDFMFQEISGLSVDVETEEVVEGGENRFVHKLPVRTKYADITLKRAIAVGTALNTWILDAIYKYKYRPTIVNVSLLNENHQPLITWKIVNAFPIQWSVTDFNAESDSLVIESLKLNYDYFTIEKPR